jgi:spermidine/putrescine transport system ATP-binding protein
MDVAVSIRNAVKRYGATTALAGVSLDIADNAFFTLLGPSGCGKTTLLRMIAGFEAASGGEILLFGQNIADLEPNLRPVNTVFQNYALFPHMSVIDNVASGIKMKGVEPATPPNSPAASSNALRWRARWRPNPRCCCSTSRSPPWI